MKAGGGLAVVIAALLLVAACDDGGEVVDGAAGTPADPVAEVARGEMLYGQYCASCHGGDLAGEANWRQADADGFLPAPPHDGTGHTWHHPDAVLFAITKHGTAALVGGDYKTRMDGFGHVLSDADIRAVLAFIKSQWPADIRARQADINRQAGGGS
ncbi:MAG: c-type cytochrome [Alphaproteobacteria bacterium]